MNIDSLDAWLQYLDSLPSGLAHKSLDHLKKLAQELDVLNFSGKVITVAGTNGKGSSVVFLESILLDAGLKTCAYLSPHLLHYSERMRINGMDVDGKSLCWAFALVEQIRARANIILSYFEFSTLAALVIFKKRNPDFLILEVGLGGRYDAVNILDSDISIITTISFDHTQVLGNTRDAIGYEKAGIMRHFKPVICGSDMPESVYLTADNIQAQLYCLNKDFAYVEREDSWEWYSGQEVLSNLPYPQLPVANAALALMARKLLSRDFKILPQAIISGLKNAFLPGRFERLVFTGKEIIFDVAHNPESAALFAANLSKIRSAGRILAVVSMLKDKDIVSVLKPLAAIVDWWYVGVLNNIRAADSSQLSQCLQDAGIANFTLLSTVAISLQQAIAECQEKDKILVFGSFYTVAESLREII